MNDLFVKEFISKLDGKVGNDQLKTVLHELEIFVSNFDIKNRNTEIIPYDNNYIPNVYKVYYVSKKIEGMSPKSLDLYDLYLKDFFFMVQKKIEEITTNDIRLYLYTIQKQRNIGNRSLDSRRLILNAFFQWCADEGYITKNVCKCINPIKFEVKERQPLNDIELELVRDACDDTRSKAIIEVLYSTGCRVTELENLKISDVNLTTREVHLFGKGNKHRTSYLNARSKVALEKYSASRSDDCESLIVTKKKPYRVLKKNGIENVVRNIGKRSGIDRPLYPHLLRHTTATDALDRGMNVAEVQKILGHQKLDTTMIYAKASQENVKHNHKKYIV